jgi:hypothetical protein
VSTSLAILAYKFPPYEKVGARRWAKLSKYLSRVGFKVHIITTNWKEMRGSWDRDVVPGPNLVVNRWGTPVDFLMRKNTGIPGRLRFLIARACRWTDEAYHYYAYHYRRIASYIRKNDIGVVVATGAPFSANYFAARLKSDFPALVLVQEFRDMWTEEFYLEYPSIRKGSLLQKKIFAMEAFSLTSCDAVVSVTPGCTTRFERRAREVGSVVKRFVTIENGFDPDDARVFGDHEFPGELFSRDSLNIAHFGTLDAGRDIAFLEFLASIKDRLSNMPIRFIQFGHCNAHTQKSIESLNLNGRVVFVESMTPSALLRYMYFADVHLAVNDPVFYYAYGSKVFEAYMYKKPVVVISARRDGLFRLVSETKTGLVTDNTPASNHLLLDQLIADFAGLKSAEAYNKDYNYDIHSMQSVASGYTSLLSDLLKHHTT